MRKGTLVFVGVVSVFGLLAPACSSSSSGGSSTTGGDGGSSGSSGSSGGDTDPCAIPPGKYLIHYTSDPNNGGNCASMADTVKTVGGTDGGTSDTDTDAGAGCTVTKDDATCTATTHCSVAGGTTDNVVTVSKGKVSGSYHLLVTAQVSFDCKYTFTWTKQ